MRRLPRRLVQASGMTDMLDDMRHLRGIPSNKTSDAVSVSIFFIVWAEVTTKVWGAQMHGLHCVVPIP